MLADQLRDSHARTAMQYTEGVNACWRTSGRGAWRDLIHRRAIAEFNEAHERPPYGLLNRFINGSLPTADAVSCSLA